MKAKQQISLATKKAFAAKSRLSNYCASLKSGGIETPSNASSIHLIKAKIIAKYQIN